MIEKIKEIMKITQDVSVALGYPIDESEYIIKDWGCPHEKPSSLPKGYAAVYFFIYNNDVLKIGKANEKSGTRYTSHHYSTKAAPSTLAKSLSTDLEFDFGDSNQIKEWILKNTRRIDILIKCKNNKAATELIESIMHYHFRPKYEGSL